VLLVVACSSRPKNHRKATEIWQCYEGSHSWRVGLSRLYSRRGPDCQQDLHDTGWGGKHKAKTLRELDCIPRHCAIPNLKNYWDTLLDCYYIITWSSGMLRFLNNSYRYRLTPKRWRYFSISTIFKLPFSGLGVSYLAPTSSPSEGSFFLLLPILQAFSIRSYKTLVS